MLHYYEQRAPEYEAIYSKPERQQDLAWLESHLKSLVSGRRVLEIACGTGYWTRRMSHNAASVHATDASQELASSALGSCNTNNVSAGVMDAYGITDGTDYDCVVAGFFYSHVPLARQVQFLSGISRAVKPGTRLVLFDNRYVEGSNTPISRRTADGDTFQLRSLADGSSFEILKNFPGVEGLRAILRGFCRQITIEESDYYWLATGNFLHIIGPKFQGLK